MKSILPFMADKKHRELLERAGFKTVEYEESELTSESNVPVFYLEHDDIRNKLVSGRRLTGDTKFITEFRGAVIHHGSTYTPELLTEPCEDVSEWEIVTVPEVPPPLIPEPAVTPVMSPTFAVAPDAIPSSLVFSVDVKFF